MKQSRNLEQVNIEDEDSMDGTSAHIPQLNSSIGSNQQRHTRGPIDAFFMPDPEAISRQAKRKLTTNEDSKKIMEHFRNLACKMFARWMYDAGIPFNAVNYDSFGPAIEAIGQHGPGMKPPTYHEVRVPLLNNEVEETNRIVEEHRKEWENIGCSIMCDGWKDKRERTLINFLVNCPKGSIFLESIDASDYSKTGDKMFELIEKCVKAVGEDKVIQVVTDSASNNVKAGKLLMRMYPHIYWTPCAAHCIDLMLEDIFKITKLKKTCSSAMALCGFIYSRPGIVNMLRYFTKLKELLRPAKTRFATSCIMLGRLHLRKSSLQKMFTSDEWNASKSSKENSGKRAQATILQSSFWKNILFALKVCGPLIKVLRLVDGEKKPPMGYIYRAMEKAKFTIESSFSNADEYKKVFEIIDNRWAVQLHQPLHAAGHFLNPDFFYGQQDMSLDPNIRKGLHECIYRLVPDTDIQDAIIDEISVYKYAQDSFSSDMAKRARKRHAPATWWENFGSSAPNLQRFAIKVLSLTCSASGCERNWSAFEHIMVSCFVKTSRFEEYLCVKEAILLDLLRVISHHRARLATPIRTMLKTYGEAEAERSPFSDLYTRTRAATNTPYLLIEPSKINNDEKTKVSAQPDSNLEVKEGSTLSSSKPDVKDASASTSGSNPNGKVDEIAASNTEILTAAPGESISSNSKKNIQYPSDVIGSSSGGGVTSGESSILNTSRVSQEPGRQSSPAKPPKQDSERSVSVLEDNILLGVALDGSKRTLPMDDEDISHSSITEEPSELASRRKGNGSTTLSKRNKDDQKPPRTTDQREKD